MSETTALPPPALPFFPPVSDPETIEKATNAYIERLLKLEQAQIAHLVKSHEGHWDLPDRERWDVYRVGPQRDHERLMAALEQEQAEQAAFGEQAQMMQQGEKPPKPEEMPMPPMPLLSDRERARHEAYMSRHPSEWYLVWLEAITSASPEEAIRMARDYASLSLQADKGKLNGASNGNGNGVYV
jgi:hypothetical protein